MQVRMILTTEVWEYSNENTVLPELHMRGKEEVEQLLCFKIYIYLVCQISQLLTTL